MACAKGLFIVGWVFTCLSGLVLSQGRHDLLKEDWCGDMSCYEVLGVLATDDFRTIKKTYNNISLALHPDKNPNATQEDKDKYVKVNKAYEILSNSELRNKYDEYLRLKSSMDSPREHPLFVLLLLYLAIVFVVYQYQKQKHGRMRKGILEIPSIQQWLQRVKKIEVTQKKQKKGKRSRGKRGSKNKKGSQSDLMSTGDDDDKAHSWMDAVSDDLINEALQKNNTIVPGWDIVPPSYSKAAVDVPIFCVTMALDAIFFVRWHVFYTLLKFDCSDSDRGEMCRRAHKKSFEEWEVMSPDEQSKFLQRPGPWRTEKDKSKKKKKKA